MWAEIIRGAIILSPLEMTAAGCTCPSIIPTISLDRLALSPRHSSGWSYFRGVSQAKAMFIAAPSHREPRRPAGSNLWSERLRNYCLYEKISLTIAKSCISTIFEFERGVWDLGNREVPAFIREWKTFRKIREAVSLNIWNLFTRRSNYPKNWWSILTNFKKSDERLKSGSVPSNFWGTTRNFLTLSSQNK